MASTLVNRNVTVAGHRTSMRLEEPSMWDALQEICRHEGKTIHEVCSDVDFRRHESALTAALRAFIVLYFRVAATEDGHAKAGHGIPEPVQAFSDDGLRTWRRNSRLMSHYKNRANAF